MMHAQPPPSTARRAHSGGRTARQQQQQQLDSGEPQPVTYVRYAPQTRMPAVLPDDVPVEPAPSASMVSGRPLSHLSRTLLAMQVDAASTGETPRAAPATVKRATRTGLPPSPKLSFMGHHAAAPAATTGSGAASSKRAQSPRIESLRPTPEEFAEAAAALACPAVPRSASANRASALTQDAISPWTLSASAAASASAASADLPEPAHAIDHFGALMDDARQRDRTQPQRPDTASSAVAASIRSSSSRNSSLMHASRPTTSGTGVASSAILTSIDPASSSQSSLLLRPDTGSTRASENSLERLHATEDAAPTTTRGAAHDHFPPRHRPAAASSARRRRATSAGAVEETANDADGLVRDADEAEDGSSDDDDESEGQREDFFAADEQPQSRYWDEEKQEERQQFQRTAADATAIAAAASSPRAAASAAASAAPFAFPIDPRSMKASHRLILEKLYGKDRADRILSQNPVSAARGHALSATTAKTRHTRATSGSSGSGKYSVVPSAPHELLSVAVTERRSRVPGLQLLADGLQTPGSIQRVREGTATLLAGPSASRPSTTPIVSHLPPPAPGVFRVGVSPDGLSPRAVLARTPREFTRGTLVSSEASDPRFTQRAHSARLFSGQTIVRAPGQTSEWPYLTARRKAQEEEMRERARLRVERMQARGGFRSTEAESARLAYVPAAPIVLPPNPKRDPLSDIPAHELGDGALPSKKRARRPPAQSAFREVSLSAGVLARVERNRPQQYRVSAAAPLPSPSTAAGGGPAGAGSGGTAAGAGSAGAGAGFHLTSDPRLSTWRQDVNSWLSAHAKHVSKSVSVAQMAELRVLYDALDDDGGDSLDLSELATAMRVCGLKSESAHDIALRLLLWMNKSRSDSLSFAEFAYAVLHFEVPAHSSEMHVASRESGGRGGGGGHSGGGAAASMSGGGLHHSAFGSAVSRTIPLFHKMMSGPAAEGRASFAQVVFEFKRQRVYAAMHKATGIEI